jgi:hypothetical protein
MTFKINTIDIENGQDLNRSVTDIDQVQSIKLNKSDGTFFVTYPLLNNGTIIQYPQNPTSSSYSSTTIKTVEDYGDIDYALDVGVDFFGNNLWIADTGNEKVISIGLIDKVFIREIEGFELPHAILVNPNNRNVFIMSFEDVDTKKLTEIDNKGNILFEFLFPGNVASLTIERTQQFMKSLPRPFTMDFDSNLNRLWWVGESVVYMMDLDTKQITTQDLQDGSLYNITSISVDKSSGNAFVVIDDIANWYVQQLYKDNNVAFGLAYLEEQDLDHEA